MPKASRTFDPTADWLTLPSTATRLFHESVTSRVFRHLTLASFPVTCRLAHTLSPIEPVSCIILHASPPTTFVDDIPPAYPSSLTVYIAHLRASPYQGPISIPHMTSSQMLSPPVIRMTPPLSPSQSTEPATRSRDAAPVATHSPPASRPIHLSLTRLYGTADGLYGARPYSPSPHTFSTRAYHMLHEYELATEFPFLGHSPGHSPRLSPSPITFSPPPRAESYPKPIPGSTGHAEPPWRNSLVEWNNQFEPSPSQRDHLSPAPPPGRSKADDYFGNWEAFTKHAAPNTTHGENLNVSPGTRYDPDAPVSPMEGHSPDLTSETGPRSSRLHDNASQPKLPSSRNIYSPPTFSPCQVPKTGGNDDSPRGGNRTFGSPLLSPQTQSLAESVVSPHTQTSIHHLEVDDTRSPEGMIFWSNRKESDGRSQVEGHGGIRAVEGDVEGAVYMRRGKSSLKRYQDAGSPKTPVGKWFSRANRLTLKRNGKNSEETSKTVAASGRTPFSFKTLPRITSPRLTFTNDSKGCNSPVSGTAQGADGCPISRYSPTETGSPIEQHPTPSFEPSSPVSPVSTLSSALDALLVTPAQSSVPLPLTIAKFDDHRDTYPSPAIKTVPDTTVKSKPLIDHTRQRHDSEVDPIVAKAYRGLWLSFPDIDKPLPEVPSHGSHSSLRVEAEAPRHQATCTSAAGRSLHDDDDSSEDSSPSAPSTPPSIAARELACHRLDPIFTERFIVRQELGAGGFGFVCTAIGTGAYGYVNQKDREFAVKFLYKEKMSSSSDYSNRFRLPVEAYVLNRCDHPNIVKLIDVFEDEKFWYIVSYA